METFENEIKEFFKTHENVLQIQFDSDESHLRPYHVTVWIALGVVDLSDPSSWESRDADIASLEAGDLRNDLIRLQNDLEVQPVPSDYLPKVWNRATVL